MSWQQFKHAWLIKFWAPIPAVIAAGILSTYYFGITGTFWAVTGEFTRWGGQLLQLFGVHAEEWGYFKIIHLEGSPLTRIDNARFFNDDVNQVPMHCITQGIGTILKARHLVLLAFGAGKAEAIAETVEGGVSAFCPASALQLHPHATIIVDEAAASRLRHKGYYKYAFAHKPSWQGI